MSVFNSSVDRVMRGLVARRMRPEIAYGPGDTAIVVVTPARKVRPDDLPNGMRLMRWARSNEVTVIMTSRDDLADIAEPWSPNTVPGKVVDLSTDPRTDLAANEVMLAPFPGLSAFTNPALSTTLAARQLDRVIIVGSRTDIEIDSTARDALETGLHTTVISDCCTGFSPAGHQSTVDITLPRLVHAVLTIDELPALTR